MNITVSLRSKSKPSPVQIIANWGYFQEKDGKKQYKDVRVSTGVTLSPEQFDFHIGKPSLEYSHNDNYHLHHKINDITRDLNLSFQSLQQKRVAVTPETLRREYDIITGKVKKKLPMPVRIDDSIDKYCTDKVLNTRTVQAYETLKTRLAEFNPKLDWFDFTTATYQEFLRHLESKGYASNTLWGYQKRLNSVINYAAKEGMQLEVRAIYKHKQSKKVKPILNWEEIDRIAATTGLWDNKKQETQDARENIRKILLVMLYTGCRISDIWKVFDPLNHKQDKEGNWYVDYTATKKVGQEPVRVVVPVFKPIQDIMKNPPYKCADVKIRDGIKRLLRDVFGADYNVRISDKDINIQEYGPHCARATFMELLKRYRVIPLYLIQSAVGHAVNYGNESSDNYFVSDQMLNAELLRKCCVSADKERFE